MGLVPLAHEVSNPTFTSLTPLGIVNDAFRLAQSYSNGINKRIIFAKRPEGALKLDSFHLREEPIDLATAAANLNDGEVLLRNLTLSIDPSLRTHMLHHKSANYVPDMEIGDPVRARNTSLIIASKHRDWIVGEVVWASSGWEDYSVMKPFPFQVDVVGLRRLPFLADPRIEWNLHQGLLGLPGITAWIGLVGIGRIKAGQTLVVSGAAGAVGSAACQIAKSKGLKVVGIVGSDEKVRWCKEILGCDGVINYKTEEWNAAIRRETAIKGAPGIDVFFDNVGGTMLDTMIRHLKWHSTVVSCGSVSQYDSMGGPSPPPATPMRSIGALVTKRIRIEGFVVSDWMFAGNEVYESFWREMPDLIRSRKIVGKHDVRNGVEK
ncbi:hypothetical protein HDU93_007293 [Gonapodya sp. JEL0774]|nr:hypothetical protein HDU93_007293 [Gonapodya sp. JEL0774]